MAFHPADFPISINYAIYSYPYSIYRRKHVPLSLKISLKYRKNNSAVTHVDPASNKTYIYFLLLRI